MIRTTKSHRMHSFLFILLLLLLLFEFIFAYPLPHKRDNENNNLPDLNENEYQHENDLKDISEQNPDYPEDHHRYYYPEVVQQNSPPSNRHRHSFSFYRPMDYPTSKFTETSTRQDAYPTPAQVYYSPFRDRSISRYVRISEEPRYYYQNPRSYETNAHFFKHSKKEQPLDLRQNHQYSTHSRYHKNPPSLHSQQVYYHRLHNQYPQQHVDQPPDYNSFPNQHYSSAKRHRNVISNAITTRQPEQKSKASFEPLKVHVVEPDRPDNWIPSDQDAVVSSWFDSIGSLFKFRSSKKKNNVTSSFMNSDTTHHLPITDRYESMSASFTNDGSRNTYPPPDSVPPPTSNVQKTSLPTPSSPSMPTKNSVSWFPWGRSKNYKTEHQNRHPKEQGMRGKNGLPQGWEPTQPTHYLSPNAAALRNADYTPESLQPYTRSYQQQQQQQQNRQMEYQSYSNPYDQQQQNQQQENYQEYTDHQRHLQNEHTHIVDTPINPTATATATQTPNPPRWHWNFGYPQVPHSSTKQSETALGNSNDLSESTTNDNENRNHHKNIDGHDPSNGKNEKPLSQQEAKEMLRMFRRFLDSLDETARQKPQSSFSEGSSETIQEIRSALAKLDRQKFDSTPRSENVPTEDEHDHALEDHDRFDVPDPASIAKAQMTAAKASSLVREQGIDTSTFNERPVDGSENKKDTDVPVPESAPAYVSRKRLLNTNTTGGDGSFESIFSAIRSMI